MNFHKSENAVGLFCENSELLALPLRCPDLDR